MTKRTQHTQVAAAAMAGISERTARHLDKDPRLPSQTKTKRSWRTREDPLVAVWAPHAGDAHWARRPDGGQYL